ncbi:MAG: LVIVD repeat-containing protein [Candidatus Dormibacteria bacterium]
MSSTEAARRPVARLVAPVGFLLSLTLTLGLPSQSLAATVVDSSNPATTVPVANCGPGSDPEPLLQGEVPRSDRLSGRSLLPYTCNLKLIGSYQEGEGASWQNAWFDHCDYYNTLPAQPASSGPPAYAGTTRTTAEGVQVIDVSDPAHPVRTAVLDTPAMNYPHESLKVNEKRGLLAAVRLNGPDFDIYDVRGDFVPSADCAHPKLLATRQFQNTSGHEGQWAPDGMTYYGSNSGVNAIDVRDPFHPQLFPPQLPASHGIAISADGNRMYEAPIVDSACGANGLDILDISQVQARNANATFKTITNYCWGDGAIPQHAIPVSYGGKQFLVFVEEAGHGAARIIDISDETNPKTVSRLHLQVNIPGSYALDIADGGNGLCDGHTVNPAAYPAPLIGVLGCPVFVYDGHYCSVDRQNDPTALACGYFESGIRIFDIRDPANPKEIAYYNPGGITNRPLPGSSQGGGTADHCTSQIRMIPATAQLWAQCQDHEFMVLQFTNNAWPFAATATAPTPVPSSLPSPVPAPLPNTAASLALWPLLLPALLAACCVLVMQVGRRRLLKP